MNIANDKQKLNLYQDALKMNIKFLRPSINKSEEYCTIEKDGIRIGLSLIKGIGIKTAIKFVDARNEYGLKKAKEVLPKRVIGSAMQKALRESGCYGNKYTNGDLQKKRLSYSLMSNVTKEQNEKIKEFLSESNSYNVRIGGKVDKIKKIKTKNNNDMGFINIVWNENSYEVVFFPNMIDGLDNLNEGDVIMVKGKKQKDYDSIMPFSIARI